MTILLRALSLFLITSVISCGNKSDNKENKTTTNEQEDSSTTNNSSNYNKNFLLGKFEYRDYPNFVLVSERWSDKEIYMQSEAYIAFEKMAKAADKDGIPLIILSGTRSFEEQKVIWERKWNKNKQETQDEIKIALKILQTSSMPSSSRHHWGTDVDINSVEESYFEKGLGLKVYTWMKKNGANYGFCQVYDNKNITKRNGYEQEKWHWSYTPLSNKILTEYKKQIKIQDINGFIGSEFAGNQPIEIIKNYVCGVSEECN